MSLRTFLEILSFDVSDRSSVLLLAPDMVVSDGPKDSHAKDKSRPIEVGNIGTRSDGEEHEDEQHAFERESSVGFTVSMSVWTGAIIRGSITHARLQKSPNFLPRLNREGNMGSPDMRLHAMHPIHIM